jgi:hypothetical protein
MSQPEPSPRYYSLYPNVTVFELDYGIGSLVFSLNKVGLTTYMSCDGHGERNPEIRLNGHNHLKLIKEILEIANHKISFAYNWEVKMNYSGMVLTAKKRLMGDKWDVRKIQDDALAFSEFLLASSLIF